MATYPLSFIDLFAGCGGFSLGLMKSGLRAVLAVEKSPDAFQTLKFNLLDESKFARPIQPFEWPYWLKRGPVEIGAFIREEKENLEKRLQKIDLVVGSPPCQGFSVAGRRNEYDRRNTLFKHYLEILKILKPNFLLMENVKGINSVFGMSRKTKNKSYASRIREKMEELNYNIQDHVIKASDFGVPQFRPRYFILGIHKNLLKGRETIDLKEMLFEKREEFLISRGLPIQKAIGVKDAISDMEIGKRKTIPCEDENSTRNFQDIKYRKPSTPFQELMHEGMNGHKPNSLRLPNHRPETIERYNKIHEFCKKGTSVSEKMKDRLQLKRRILVPLHPDMPAHTLTTIPDDLIHYSESRIHSVRENARLQSFPDWFEFKGKFTTGGNRRKEECPRYTQVGNAVSPLLAEIIGETIQDIAKILLPPRL